MNRIRTVAAVFVGVALVVLGAVASFRFSPRTTPEGQPPLHRLDALNLPALRDDCRDCVDRRKGAIADFVKAARTTEIEPGQARLVEVKGKQLPCSTSAASSSPSTNTCTHRSGPLAEGEVSGNEVTCPWHGATFDVRTGEVIGPPAQRAVARYGVRVTGTDIEVEV